MKPTELLKHEHEVILLVLGAARREAAYIRQNGGARVAKVESIVDFVRNFADKCHHKKEEEHLFAKLLERGMSHDKGPVASMLRDHIVGRQAVKAISDALAAAGRGDKSALDEVAKNLESYADLLESHIEKENGGLFPLADRILTWEDQKALERAFDKVEKEETGEGVHEKYHRIAHELAEE